MLQAPSPIPPGVTRTRLGRCRPLAAALGIGVGLAAFVWFLIRVVPKPSRASYPCQRAAFPIASAFVLWIAGSRGAGLWPTACVGGFRGFVSPWW